MAFAFGLNLLLITRYLYPEWLSSGLVTMAFWVGIVVWGFYVVRSIRELPQLIAPRRVSDDPDRFPEAHAAYLQGQWREAEQRLTEVLAIEPRDPPALLLLTGVYRHTERLEAAELLLNEIGRLEVADRWWLEVDAEKRRLERARRLRHERKAETAPSEETPPAADLTEPQRSAA
jgi:thioredoxin-like negative regulator of GroEL